MIILNGREEEEEDEKKEATDMNYGMGQAKRLFIYNYLFVSWVEDVCVCAYR